MDTPDDARKRQELINKYRIAVPQPVKRYTDKPQRLTLEKFKSTFRVGSLIYIGPYKTLHLITAIGDFKFLSKRVLDVDTYALEYARSMVSDSWYQPVLDIPPTGKE